MSIDTSSAKPPSRPRRRIPRTVLVKTAVLVAIVICGVVLARYTPLAEYLTEEKILAARDGLRQLWWTPLLLIGLCMVFSTIGIPVSPVILGGGAVFGFLVGWLYNTIGLLLGAAVSYFVAKLLGRELIVHLFGQRLQRVEHTFEKHGFWPLVHTRFLPIPFTLVNYAAALAGVKPYLFLLSTAVGLVPATAMHTYFVARLIDPIGRERWTILGIYLATWMLLNVVVSLPSIYRYRRHRRGHAIQAESPPSSEP